MVSWAETEMSGAVIPDRRAIGNLIGMCANLLENAGLSFSSAVGHGRRQAATRLFSNPNTSVPNILQGHFDRTCMRCWNQHTLVLVAQDTTVINYTSHPATDGLGLINDNLSLRGLHAHSALAMTTTGLPLGVVHLDIWARKPEEKGSAALRKQKPTDQKESEKWLKGLQGIERSLGNHLSVGRRILVIQDREADIFDFIAAPRHTGTDLLIRASQPRSVSINGGADRTNLFQAVASVPSLGQYVVDVPPTNKSAAREATLELRIQQVTILAPQSGVVRRCNDPQTVWVIQASEKAPPEGMEALAWTLISTMPVHDFESARRMVEYYTRRWVIERLHYTLKSGLKVERLQFDDAHTLSNALATCWVVAWRIMYLTYVARENPDEAARHHLEVDELTVLEQMEGKPIATIAQAIQAIAKLAGYYPTPKGGPSGVKSLWIGLRKLEAIVIGWRLAIGAQQ